MSQELSQLSETPPLPGAVAIPNINKIIRTIATDFAGADDPAAMAWPYCTWADTGNNLKKRRNAANSAWVVEGELFQQTARRNGDPTQDFSAKNISISSVNGGQLAGLRNKIINGAFQINQRAYVSGAATTVGQYTLDRWKVTGTGGVTFATVNNKTTVTIPAGQTLQQVIEGLNLQSGVYVLSWEGTAQGRIGAGTYGNSGEVTATIVGGTDTTIEFGEGTVSNVQFDPGTVAASFEHRPYGTELALCQRYYEKSSFVGYNYFGGAGPGWNVLNQPFKVEKRAAPSITFSVTSYATCSSIVAQTVTTSILHATVTASATGGGSVSGTFEATIEL